VANATLEGTYTERSPNIYRNTAACRADAAVLVPGGFGSHATPRSPAPSTRAVSWATRLAHAHGAVFANPGLIAACVIGGR